MSDMNVTNKHSHHHLHFHHHADKTKGQNGDHKAVAGSLGSVNNSSAHPPKLPTTHVPEKVGAEIARQPKITVKVVVSGHQDASVNASSTLSRPSRPLPPPPGAIASEKSAGFTRGQIPSGSKNAPLNRVLSGIRQQVNNKSVEKGINASTPSEVKTTEVDVKNESIVDRCLRQFANENTNGIFKFNDISGRTKYTSALLAVGGKKFPPLPDEKNESNFYVSLKKGSASSINTNLYSCEIAPFVICSPNFLSELKLKCEVDLQLCRDIETHQSEFKDILSNIDTQITEEVDKSAKQQLEAKKSDIQAVNQLVTRIATLDEALVTYNDMLIDTITTIRKSVDDYYSEVETCLENKNQLSDKKLSANLKAASTLQLAKLETVKAVLEDNKAENQNPQDWLDEVRNQLDKARADEKSILETGQKQTELTPEDSPEQTEKQELINTERLKQIRESIAGLSTSERILKAHIKKEAVNDRGIALENAIFYIDQAIAEARSLGENTEIASIERDLASYKSTGMSCTAKEELDRYITNRIIPTIELLYKNLSEKNSFDYGIFNILAFSKEFIIPMLENIKSGGQSTTLSCKDNLIKEVAVVQKGIDEKINKSFTLITGLLDAAAAGKKIKLSKELIDADKIISNVAGFATAYTPRSYMYLENVPESPIYGYRKTLGLEKGTVKESRLHNLFHRESA